MAKKKKGRRAALKGFAKGKFQSPVHSNGYKQDMLIDLYGGDKGFPTGYGTPPSSMRAEEALAAGKEYFIHGGTMYKAGSEVVRGRTAYTATADPRTGKVK